MSSRGRFQIKAWCLFLVLTAGITAIDLWTKDAVFDLLEVVGTPPVVEAQEEMLIIPGFFDLQATYNRGALYGMFARHTDKLTLLSALAAFVIVGILAYSLMHERLPSIWFVVALGAICGGTLGNLYDRHTLGAVRDWIKWYVVWDDKELVWPNFNIADSGICVGVGLLILLEVIGAIRGRKERAVEGEKKA